MVLPVPAGRAAGSSPALSSQGCYAGRRGGSLSRSFFPLNGEPSGVPERWRRNRLQLFVAECETQEEGLRFPFCCQSQFWGSPRKPVRQRAATPRL